MTLSVVPEGLAAASAAV
ncbi:PE family protein PE27A, partial [Mycobacterium tuberculosis TKK_02_0055]